MRKFIGFLASIIIVVAFVVLNAVIRKHDVRAGMQVINPTPGLSIPAGPLDPSPSDCDSSKINAPYYQSTATEIFMCSGSPSPQWNLVIGAVGPQGPQGVIGNTGPQGTIGNTGPTGSQGIQGNAGSNGAAGTNGTNGSPGVIWSLNGTAQTNVKCNILTATTNSSGVATFNYSGLGFTSLLGQPQASVSSPSASTSPYFINIVGTPSTSSTTVQASVGSIISVVGINVTLIGVAVSAPVGLWVCGV